MFRKKYHWVEGLLVVALLAAMTWMNSSSAAPDDQAGARGFENGVADRNLSAKGRLGNEKKRIREGTMIDNTVGYFQQDGDGATFVTEDGFELGGLPNLNLERVVRTLKTSDESKTIRWRVTGTVTEFSGRNYLFITRAVYKSTTPPPVPSQLVIQPESN